MQHLIESLCLPRFEQHSQLSPEVYKQIDTYLCILVKNSKETIGLQTHTKWTKQEENVTQKEKPSEKSQGDYKISMPRYNYHHFEFEMAI